MRYSAGHFFTSFVSFRKQYIVGLHNVMKIRFTLFLIILNSPLWCQSGIYPIKKIDSLYKSGNYAMALKLNTEYLTQVETRKVCGDIPFALYKAAELSAMLKNRDEAYLFIRQALSQAKNCKNDSVIWFATRYLGGLFHRYETRDSSLFYLNKAYALIKDKNQPNKVSSTVGMIGETWNHLYNNPTKAIEFYKLSISEAEKSRNYKPLGYAYLRYGSFLAHHGNCSEGVPFVEKSVNLFRTNNDTEGLYWTRYSLSRVYKTCERLREAYQLLDEHIQAQDSVFNADAARHIAEYQTLYETVKKEKENLELNIRVEAETKLRQNLTWLYSLATCVLLALFYVIYRQHNMKKKFELDQKIRTERERISLELHDNIGTQLSQLSSSLDWLHNPQNTISEEEKKNISQHNRNIAKLVIKDLRETIWALRKNRIPFTDFADKLKTSLQNLAGPQNQTLIQYTEKLDDTAIGSEEALDLLRICQEAVNNALLHSGTQSIHINLWAASQHYKITITDYGNGFSPPEVTGEHYGLINMKQRAKQVGAIFTIQSDAGNGTTITIAK